MCLQLKSRFLIGKKCNWSLACCLQLDCLIFSSSKVKLQPCVLVQRSPSSFGQFSKKAVIVWFNFYLGCKCFNVGHTSDYPLRHAHLRPVCSVDHVFLLLPLQLLHDISHFLIRHYPLITTFIYIGSDYTWRDIYMHTHKAEILNPLLQ